MVRKLKGTSRSKRDVHVIRVECLQRTPILLQGQLLKGKQGLSSRALFAEVMTQQFGLRIAFAFAGDDVLARAAVAVGQAKDLLTARIGGFFFR